MCETETDAVRRIGWDLADAAATETLAHFRSAALTSQNKDTSGGFDPVTVADRAAESAMRAILEAQRPGDGILGEEAGVRAGSSGLTWVLDPIDGTRGYVSGTPTWGTLIGLRDARRALYGIIDQPYTGERFEGGFGIAQVTRAGTAAPLRCRATTALSDAILFSTFPEVGTPAEGAAFARVARSVRLTRYGMDCYAYALLALGQIDLVIEAGLHPYDIVAPIAVVEAAGGVVTDWDGGSVLGGGQVIAAATPDLHAAALALLRSDL